MLAALNIPYMAQETYSVNHDKPSTKIRETARSVLEKAWIQEARLARENGDIGDYPLVTVVGDGAWCKYS